MFMSVLHLSAVVVAIYMKHISPKPISNSILVKSHVNQLSNRFEISHRARQDHHRTLCNLPKRHDYLNGCSEERDFVRLKCISDGYLVLQHPQFGLAMSSLGVYSVSGRASYRKVSWNLEAARLGFCLSQSLWNLTGTSAATLLRCRLNYRITIVLTSNLAGSRFHEIWW